jgi:hypothetical protein
MFFELIQNPPFVTTDQPTTTSVSADTVTKYFNLMEETFGSNWAKEPTDKYFSQSYCTIGK